MQGAMGRLHQRMVVVVVQEEGGKNYLSAADCGDTAVEPTSSATAPQLRQGGDVWLLGVRAAAIPPGSYNGALTGAETGQLPCLQPKPGSWEPIKPCFTCN